MYFAKEENLLADDFSHERDHAVKKFVEPIATRPIKILADMCYELFLDYTARRKCI